MNSKYYYKIGACIAGIACIVMLMLIIQSFTAQPILHDRNEQSFISELRSFRQVLSDINQSKNPAISESLRKKCAEELIEVTQLIESFENGIAEELTLRSRFDVLVHEILADPYLNITTKNNFSAVNGTIDI